MRIAILTTLVAAAAPALFAADPNPFGCSPVVGVTPTVRAEGLSELIGDIVLNCTGGTPTPGGIAIPPAKIVLTLNTNITSKLIKDNGASEAVMLIDDPNSAKNPTIPITPCMQLGLTALNNPVLPFVSGCPIISNGTGIGNYKGGAANSNAYPGVVNGNRLVWLGVPIHPRSTAGTWWF